MNISLENLHLATAQQVFDQVATHLLTQNERSFTSGNENECAYKGKDGLKCAAGCLISDDNYKIIGRKSIEGKNWGFVIGYLEKKLPNVAAHNELIFRLQNLHDNESPKHWHYALIKLANSEGLTMPTLPV